MGGGSVLYYECLPIMGREPGLPIVLPGWGYPCANFLGSGAVVLWGLRVQCGRVEDVSSSHGSVGGQSAKLRMPTHKGEGTWATCSLTRLGRPLRKFLGVQCFSFLGFWVRCGRVKLVSSSRGFMWWVSAELRMPIHKGEGTWDTHSLTRLGRPLRKFLAVRCGSYLGFWGPVR